MFSEFHYYYTTDKKVLQETDFESFQKYIN